MMDITRNQFFCVGLLCLFLGVELRLVESFELNPEFTRFIAERTGHSAAPAIAGAQSLTGKPPAGMTIQLPEWRGWALISIGSVLVLHSWGMKKPGT